LYYDFAQYQCRAILGWLPLFYEFCVPPQLNAAILTELKLVEKKSSKYKLTACKTLRMKNSTHVNFIASKTLRMLNSPNAKLNALEGHRKAKIILYWTAYTAFFQVNFFSFPLFIHNILNCLLELVKALVFSNFIQKCIIF